MEDSLVAELQDLIQLAANRGAFICPLAGRNDKPEDHVVFCVACRLRGLVGQRYIAPETEMLKLAINHAGRPYVVLEERSDIARVLSHRIDELQMQGEKARRYIEMSVDKSWPATDEFLELVVSVSKHAATIANDVFILQGALDLFQEATA